METDSQAPDLVKGSNSGLSFGPQLGDMELASSTASRGGDFTKMTPAGESHAQATVKWTDLQVKWVQDKMGDKMGPTTKTVGVRGMQSSSTGILGTVEAGSRTGCPDPISGNK